jgi:RecB family endonuclease NucS
VYDEVLFEVDANEATLVDRVELSDVELQERAHLQEWILAHPAILGPGVEIIASEFDRWQTSAGDPVLDRLDILAVDPAGRIVVAELKRGIAPHAVHMQALNYAAMVSRLHARGHRRALFSHQEPRRPGHRHGLGTHRLDDGEPAYT